VIYGLDSSAHIVMVRIVFLRRCIYKLFVSVALPPVSSDGGWYAQNEEADN